VQRDIRASSSSPGGGEEKRTFDDEQLGHDLYSLIVPDLHRKAHRPAAAKREQARGHHSSKARFCQRMQAEKRWPAGTDSYPSFLDPRIDKTPALC
jgi:hypothetical protein